MPNGSVTPHVKRNVRSGTQVATMVLNLDKVIPSELSLLDDAVAEIRAAIDRTAYWEDVESIGLAVQLAVLVHGHADAHGFVGLALVTVDYGIDKSFRLTCGLTDAMPTLEHKSQRWCWMMLLRRSQRL